MLKLAVVGKDVSKSLSPQMHRFLLEKMHTGCIYDAISVPPSLFSARVEELLEEYDGLNVTIPFKGEILPFLSALEGDAADFRAVNTVRCKERKGYNTDGYGFMLMLENAGIAPEGKRALVLGAGGAGRSCIKKLADAGADVYAYERDAKRLGSVYRELGGFTPLADVGGEKFELVFNCTGVGMHDTEGRLPAVMRQGEEVSAECLLPGASAAVDLIYTPEKSAFLAAAEELGVPTLNGMGMLFYQAYMADCIFLGRKGNAAEAKIFYEEYKGGSK